MDLCRGSANYIIHSYLSNTVLDYLKNHLKPGNLILKSELTIPKLYVRIWDGSTVLAEMQGNSTKQITQEMINNENMRVECFLYGSAGSIITPGTYHPMLYQDGDGTWEPYTGGRPSPSPEYPQEIVSTDVTAVTVTGAQVIPYPYLDTTKTSNGVTFTDMGNGGIKITGTITNQYTTFTLNNNLFLPPGIYTKNVSEEFGLAFLISRYINNKYDIVVVRANDKTFDTSSWDYNKYEYRVLIQVTELGTFNTIFYPMINRGDTALPWEPYQSKTASITLTKPLRGIGDYRDEITMTNRIDRCMELTFDGSEDCWGVYTSSSRTGFSAINVLSISMNNRNGICNQALVGGNEEVERIVLGSNNQNLYYFYCPFYDATVADKGLSAWKAHLAAHPLKVVTYLDTPVETDLGADTIAALAELTTYKGRTTTTVTAEGPEPDVTLEYVQDTRMVIADLQAQINEIRNGGTT